MTRTKAERFLSKHTAVVKFSKDDVHVEAAGHTAEGKDLRAAVKALKAKLPKKSFKTMGEVDQEFFPNGEKSAGKKNGKSISPPSS